MVMLGMKGSGHITILVSDEVAWCILGSVARRCRADAAMFSREERLQRALAGAVAIRVPAPRSAQAAAARPSRRKSLLALLRPRLWAAPASGT